MSCSEIVFSLNGKLLSHTRLRAFVFTPVVWRYRFRPRKWERMNFRLLFSTYGKSTFSLLMLALIVNVTIVTMASAEIKTKLTSGGAAKGAQCFPRQIKDKPLSALVLYARFRVFIRRCVVFAQSAKMSSAHAEPLFFWKLLKRHANKALPVYYKNPRTRLSIKPTKSKLKKKTRIHFLSKVCDVAYVETA